MPYRSNDDLPDFIKQVLPDSALSIYRENFNHAFTAHPVDGGWQERAHRVAWATVMRFCHAANRDHLDALS
ncbi:MAG TPA: ChaB family protein [Pseudolabrys sp.]|nr:ChaB family protein [Pseudolabrys sp.]